MNARIELRNGDVLVGEAAEAVASALAEMNAHQAEVLRIALARQSDIDWRGTSSRVTSPLTVARSADRAVAEWRAAGSPDAPARPPRCVWAMAPLWERPS